MNRTIRIIENSSTRWNENLKVFLKIKSCHRSWEHFSSIFLAFSSRTSQKEKQSKLFFFYRFSIPLNVLSKLFQFISASFLASNLFALHKNFGKHFSRFFEDDRKANKKLFQNSFNSSPSSLKIQNSTGDTVLRWKAYTKLLAPLFPFKQTRLEHIGWIIISQFDRIGVYCY